MQTKGTFPFTTINTYGPALTQFGQLEIVNRIDPITIRSQFDQLALNLGVRLKVQNVFEWFIDASIARMSTLNSGVSFGFGNPVEPRKAKVDKP
jgi:hypothetical protein